MVASILTLNRTLDPCAILPSCADNTSVHDFLSTSAVRFGYDHVNAGPERFLILLHGMDVLVFLIISLREQQVICLVQIRIYGLTGVRFDTDASWNLVKTSREL
jgi:hypothetical protein